MKKLIFFVSLSFLVGNVYAAKKAAVVEKPLLTNATDSLSYAIGVDLGGGMDAQLKQIFGDDINKELLIKAFSEAFLGTPTLMESGDVGPYIQQTMAKSQEKKAAEATKKNEEFLAANAKDKDVETLPSGLQYKVLKEGTGAKPAATDQVKVHYEGRLVDGTVFDSSIERGEPITFPLNGVIAGWTEGLQLMSIGSKYRLFIPHHLGYGERGAGQQIPPFATLIFDVELLDIIK